MAASVIYGLLFRVNHAGHESDSEAGEEPEEMHAEDAEY